MVNFDNIAAMMRLHGMPVPKGNVEINVENASEVLRLAMAYFLKKEARDLQWLPEYAQVADWLSDNKGRGLFLYGDSGRGKSLLARYVLPAVLLGCCGKVVSVFDIQQMNRNLDDVLAKRILTLDDIGTEEESVHYGQRRLAFAEVMDSVEKDSKLVIVTSNLTVARLKDVYGDRIVDRIRATTRQVLFRGESLRR